MQRPIRLLSNRSPRIGRVQNELSSLAVRLKKRIQGMIIWNLALVSSLMFLSLEVKYDENTGNGGMR